MGGGGMRPRDRRADGAWPGRPKSSAHLSSETGAERPDARITREAHHPRQTAGSGGDAANAGRQPWVPAEVAEQEQEQRRVRVRVRVHAVRVGTGDSGARGPGRRRNGGVCVAGHMDLDLCRCARVRMCRQDCLSVSHTLSRMLQQPAASDGATEPAGTRHAQARHHAPARCTPCARRSGASPAAGEPLAARRAIDIALPFAGIRSTCVGTWAVCPDQISLSHAISRSRGECEEDQRSDCHLFLPSSLGGGERVACRQQTSARAER